MATNEEILNKSMNQKSLRMRRFCLYITFRDNEWWRWGELNPRPKALPQDLLRAQSVLAGIYFPVPLPPGKPTRLTVR